MALVVRECTSNRAGNEESPVRKLTQVVTSLKVKLFDNQEENKEMKMKIWELKKQLAYQQEKHQRELDEWKIKFDESQQTLQLLEVEMTINSKAIQDECQRNVEDLKEKCDKLKTERDAFVSERQEITALVRQLGNIVDLPSGSGEHGVAQEENIVSLMQNACASVQKEVAQCKNWMKRFGDFYEETCRMTNNNNSSLPPHPINSECDFATPVIANITGALPAASPMPCNSQSTSRRSVQMRGRVKRRNKNSCRQRTRFVASKKMHQEVAITETMVANGRRFRCSCAESFNQRAYLKSHIREMTQEWKYWCPPCGWYFFYASHLRNHQKSLSCLANKMKRAASCDTNHNVTPRSMTVGGRW